MVVVIYKLWNIRSATGFSRRESDPDCRKVTLLDFYLIFQSADAKVPRRQAPLCSSFNAPETSEIP